MSIITTIFKHGPLGLIWRISRLLHKLFNKITFINRIFEITTNQIVKLQYYYDSRFDKQFGTDTSGVISIKDLAIKSKNIGNAIWYEPMSEYVFHQIIKTLPINFNQYTFIDLGSGKGRVLLMAANYRFNRIIGVEFASDLNLIANQNIDIFKKKTNTTADITSICEDATLIKFPNEPLVIFFYSPFNGEVMKNVVSNISASYVVNKKEMILIFYGGNNLSIDQLKETNFNWKELKVSADWTRLIHYRAFIYISSELNSQIKL